MPEDVKTVAQLNAEIGVKARELRNLFEESTGEGGVLDLSLMKSFAGTNEERLGEIQRRHKELDDLGQKRDARAIIENAAADAKRWDEHYNKPTGLPGGAPGGVRDAKALAEGGGMFKSPGRLFVESKAFSDFNGKKGPSVEVDTDLKAVFQTGAGWAPESLRQPGVHLDPQRPISVVENIPNLPTGQAAIVYMEETTFTNNAAEKAESTATTAADLIGEAALALTERTQTVQWLPVFIPVTLQQMEDVEGIEAYVNQRLSYMLRARLDLQVLQGNGTSPNIEGTNNVTGINTQALGGDTKPDAIYKGMDKVRTVGFAEPSVGFIHPNDWQDIRLLKTADGIYVWGSPMDAGPDRIWGMRVVSTTAAAEGTMTLGDYTNHAALFTKRGITLEVSDSHAYYFTRGMLAIRADMRVAMVHYRPEAFCTVTGL